MARSSARPGMRVTLLGTGTPIPDPQRRGPSQVIEIENDLVLIDAGSGVLHRLLEAGYPQPALRRIVFTHPHSDHLTGLPPDLHGRGVAADWFPGGASTGGARVQRPRGRRRRSSRLLG